VYINRHVLGLGTINEWSASRSGRFTLLESVLQNRSGLREGETDLAATGIRTPAPWPPSRSQLYRLPNPRLVLNPVKSIQATNSGTSQLVEENSCVFLNFPLANEYRMYGCDEVG
jgi:hypothetical protein